MIEAVRLGTVENVPIDGVGKVFWTPRVVNEQIAPPSPSASRLFLYLDAPFRRGGFESVQLVKYQTGIETLHTSSDITGAKEPPRFPGWFMNFTLDLQDWTQAEAVDCINNANDYGPDEIEFRI